MSAAAQTEAVAASEHGRIPVLDIGPYLAGETGAAARLGRAIAPTFEDTGFLVIADHGVSPRLVEDTFAVAMQFFARPAADKLALKCRTELHDPTDPLSAAPQLGGERVRLRPAHRQQFPDLPRAVGAAGSRGAHRRGRVDPAAGAARDIRRQHWGDAGALFERPLSGDAAPRYQPERGVAIRDPVLPRAEPRLGGRVRPDLRRPDNPPRYEPTTYGAFSQRLLTLNFAHRRAEGGAAG
jgi:non-haem dioxygenase in morphine synthesis N-terminal